MSNTCGDNEVMSKKQPTRGEALAKAIISEYKLKSKCIEDMRNALRDVLEPIFEAMLNGKIENHLGYEANERSEKETTNHRNDYTTRHQQEKFLLMFRVIGVAPFSLRLYKSVRRKSLLLRAKYLPCMLVV